jgi:hypothetical protein
MSFLKIINLDLILKQSWELYFICAAQVEFDSTTFSVDPLTPNIIEIYWIVLI